MWKPNVVKPSPSNHNVYGCYVSTIPSHASCLWSWVSHMKLALFGGWPTPLKNMKVSDSYSQLNGKKMIQTINIHQPGQVSNFLATIVTTSPSSNDSAMLFRSLSSPHFAINLLTPRPKVTWTCPVNSTLQTLWDILGVNHDTYTKYYI